tara:strand:- start:110 stop:565 length:456 start_codon:yes stop_codon:yes gene_type:complete
MSSQVIFHIYKRDNTENAFLKTYQFELKQTVLDVKKTILNEFYKDQFNYADLINITEKVYKDYGLLFFDKGIISSINDNYSLDKLTIGNREFTFLIEPSNKELTKRVRDNNTNTQFQNKRTSYENSRFPKNNISNEYVFSEDDFPPLGGGK